ncbi:MAG: ATPase, T2SS/T4P/T4SS family [Vulcanimicrobiaceae bacterium]|jgi:pilus assembly protein CpaF
MRRERTVAVFDGDLSGRRGIAVLLDAVRTFDGLRAEGLPPIANIDNLKVVELAESLTSSFALRADSVERLLMQLSDVDTIIVDAPQPYAGALLPLMSRTARFLIVMEPTLLGATGARVLSADHLRPVPRNRLSVVVQARDMHYGEVQRGEIERLLELPIIAEIPPRNDRGHGKAVAALARELGKIAPSEDRIDLLTSNTPIGERRTDQRRDEMRDAQLEAEKLSAEQPSRAGQRKSWEQLKARIHANLASALDAASMSRSDEAKVAEVRQHVREFVSHLLIEEPGRIPLEMAEPLVNEVMSETLGLGPLEGLLGRPDISEIMINGPRQIYIERNGKLELSVKTFRDEQQLRLIVERIIAPLGRHVDESAPMVDARLPDGSRVNAIIPPLALDGTTVTIRCFGTKALEVADLIHLGAVTPDMMDFLRAAVEARLNIAVSGGTGSGKTTFLNVLSTFIPATERIVSIEDSAELQLHQEHVVRLEGRPPNIEGRGEVRIRDLVRNSLRMRPDRIIVGECRGPEALDMLQAMNTGHDGSLTTIHSNSSRDTLARIETMVMMAGFDLPIRVIREQIASAINLIIHTSRLRDGSRKIMSVDEVIGMEGDVITMQEIFAYRLQGLSHEVVQGQFEYTGVRPESIKRFEEQGVVFNLARLSPTVVA